MLRTKMFFVLCVAGIPACTPFALAPGADQIRVTNLAADVAGCTPVGNIRAPRNQDGLISYSRALGQAKNQTIGLGGNAAFVTEGTLKVPEAGIAYQCPKAVGTR